MNLVLKKVDKIAITPLHSILVSCGKAMYEQLGLNHWYPFMNIEIFQRLMKTKDLYGIYQNEIAVATFNVSTEPRDYYSKKLWLNSQEKALYLGQLAINPSIQGNGIGKWCMLQVEQIAYDAGINLVRFDALDKHPWLKSFYKKLGYEECAIVKPGEWELTCFEKQIT